MRRWSVLVLLWTLAAMAAAHTRWFTTLADDTKPPLPLAMVFGSPLFMLLFGATMAVTVGVEGLDRRFRKLPGALGSLMGRADQAMTGVAAPFLRRVMALYFASMAGFFSAAPVTLTPELTASTSWVVSAQVVIAGWLLFQRTAIVGCIGIVLLFFYSAQLHGWVHLIDYHLFLGVCVFLVLHRLSPRQGATTGLLVLRLLVGSSFLWVGIEKWLYPHWTEDVLVNRLPMILMGMPPSFVVMAAGFVEVALAFLLVFGGLSSQVAAAVLLLLLGGAIPLAGAVDGIGHLPMLAALVILATTRNRLGDAFLGRAEAVGAGLGGTFVIVVPGLGGLYFLTHQVAAAGTPWGYSGSFSLSLLWIALLLAWASWTSLPLLREHASRVRGRLATR